MIRLLPSPSFKGSALVLFVIIFLSASIYTLTAQNLNNRGSNHGNKFEQLGTMLRSPNTYRTASGAPGPDYWQQRADYTIKAKLDEVKQILSGKEIITYYNSSSDVLTYLWLQLDENEHDPKSDNQFFDPSKMNSPISDQEIRNFKKENLNDLGDKIEKVTDLKGIVLPYTINQTMMRIELPQPLHKGESFTFHVAWHYKIPDRQTVGGRGGYEYFPKDRNNVYTIAQWYPRMAAYTDEQGWQNKQFTGTGEFSLTFGTFDVEMIVPSDHIIGATGQCLNYTEVLTPKQLSRWQKAQTVKEPIEIVTLEEAKKNEIVTNSGSKTFKTWHFHADKVRDFAWTSSRKFIWDAMPVVIGGKTIMCMSYYGKEAYSLYRKYSTKLVAHTLRSYSKHTLDYPYPVAQSVEASNGMEYPMICFNHGRPENDGTYTETTKNAMIGVIIHEVGHNFFPMIINSDERQWTWMDEGINTFCQFMAEQELDNHFPSTRGPAYKVTDYMKLPKDQLEPIMTNSENIIHFGANPYLKTATAMNILRETIMGRKTFDYAFKEYSRRWAFKHPTPEDLFRTLEDASAVDLDWFWRGWFYGTDPVDISLDSVKSFKADVDSQPKPVTYSNTIYHNKPYEDISRVRNRDQWVKFEVDQDTSLKDFYSTYKAYEVTPQEIQIQTLYSDTLSSSQKQTLLGSNQFYELSFTNKGGLVMPIIVEWTFADGTKEIDRVPAYIWRKNEDHVTKVFMKSKEVREVRLDPFRETGDINEGNNTCAIKVVPTPFQIYSSKSNARGQSSGLNPMQKVSQK